MVSTDNSQDHTQDASRKPTLWQVFGSFPLLSHGGMGLLLVGTLCMPHVTGCDQVDVYPIEAIRDDLAQNGQIGSAVARGWPHLFGLYATLSVSLVGVLRSRQSDRILGGLGLAVWGVTLTAGSYGIASNAISQHSVGPVLIFGPILLVPSAFVFAGLRRRDWITSWATCMMWTSAVTMVWVYICYLFHSGIRYGLYVTYTALLALLVTPWVIRNQWEYLFIDRGAVRRPFQFSLWQIFLLSTALPLVYAYYEFLHWWESGNR